MFEETNQTEKMELPENLFGGDEEDLFEGIQETTPEDLKEPSTLEDEGGSPSSETPAEGEQTVRVKYNGEERDIPISEAIVLAQKGMNYDHILGERDELGAVIDEYAAAAGMPRGEYLNFLKESLQKVKDEREVESLRGNYPTADESVLKALRERDSELNKFRSREKEEQEFVAPWTKFFTNHPEIRPEDISEEFETLVKEQKLSPEEAFLTLKVRDYENADAAKKTNEENARRAVGSVSGDGAKAKDPFLEGFWG